MQRSRAQDFSSSGTWAASCLLMLVNVSSNTLLRDEPSTNSPSVLGKTADRLSAMLLAERPPEMCDLRVKLLRIDAGIGGLDAQADSRATYGNHLRGMRAGSGRIRGESRLRHA